MDRPDRRDVELVVGIYEQLTSTQCILACQAREFPFAAIQAGGECRCGHAYGKHGHVPDAECDQQCITGERCGGHDRNSIYSVLVWRESAETGEWRDERLAGWHCRALVWLRVDVHELGGGLSWLFR